MCSREIGKASCRSKCSQPATTEAPPTPRGRKREEAYLPPHSMARQLQESAFDLIFAPLQEDLIQQKAQKGEVRRDRSSEIHGVHENV